MDKNNYYILIGLRKIKTDSDHQIYSLNIKGEGRDRNMQGLQSKATTNYTDLKPSPNSSITKNEDNRNNKDVRHSLRNVDGSKKTNQQLWYEQQAKFSKLIEEKKAKENAPKTGTPIQRLKENLAYMADRAEYNFTNKRVFNRAIS